VASKYPRAMKLESANLIVQELMDRFRIPSGLAGKNSLPPEGSTRSKVVGVKILLAKGTIEVSVKEIEDSINLSTGLFELNGLLGAVYLHTSFNAGWDVEGLAKWHVSLCETLRTQMNLGRLHEKYALRSAEDTRNDFDLSLMSSGQKIRRELRPCKNCLRILGQKSKVYRDAYSYKFSNYVKEFSKTLEPPMDLSGFKKDPTPNTYNSDFKEKASAFKKIFNSCNHCGEKFALNCIEVHHKNRLKYDDRPENWEVLCLTCHVKEHRHDNPRMKAFYGERLSDFYLQYPHKRAELAKL